MANPIVDGLEVTPKIYKVAIVVLSLEKLRDEGLIDGGMDADVGRLEAIRNAGPSGGYERADGR